MQSTIKLFCIPHAGGSAISYKVFKKYLPSYIELIPLQLSGRGTRIGEPLYNSFEDAVLDLYKQITPLIQEEPFALLGHSMGSWLAYELYYKLAENHMPLPIHLFFSGNTAPCSKNNKKIYHNLDDNPFLEHIRELGGTDPAFFSHPELIELFLPILRSDYKMLECHTFHPKPMPITCDLSILIGLDDNTTTIGIEAWSNYTSKKCTIYPFEGNHFYLFNHPQAFSNCLTNCLGTPSNSSKYEGA